MLAFRNDGSGNNLYAFINCFLPVLHLGGGAGPARFGVSIAMRPRAARRISRWLYYFK